MTSSLVINNTTLRERVFTELRMCGLNMSSLAKLMGLQQPTLSNLFFGKNSLSENAAVRFLARVECILMPETFDVLCVAVRKRLRGMAFTVHNLIENYPDFIRKVARTDLELASEISYIRSQIK